MQNGALGAVLIWSVLPSLDSTRHVDRLSAICAARLPVLSITIQTNSDVKKRLITEIVDGGLRGLRDFFQTLTTNSEGIIREIENILERRGLETDPILRNVVAKRAMFELLNLMALGFIRKCGLSVASPHLNTAIEEVIRERPSTSYKLIRASIDLDRQGALDDFMNLKRLSDDLAKNSFAQSILQHFVMLHLHLFSTTGAQKQQISDALKIDIRKQRAIDLKTKGRKRENEK